jgi:C1A family cysteine protease
MPIAGAARVWKRKTDSERINPFDVVRKELEGGRAAVMVLKFNDAFSTATANPISDASGPDRGIHAMLAVGVEATAPSVLVRNSWGPDWGDGGHAWVDAGYLAARCSAVVIFKESA